MARKKTRIYRKKIGNFEWAGGGTKQCRQLIASKHAKGVKGTSKGPVGSWRAEAEADATGAASHTPVTLESFAAFRREWEAQRAAAKAAKVAKAAKGSGGRNVAAADDGLTGRQLFERSGMSLIEDAGDLDEGEEDVMAIERVAADEEAEEAEEAEEEGGGGESSGASLLAAVGDEALFDEDEDEDLPDDEDE